MDSTICTLCGLDQPASEMNRHGECRECREQADHLISEGYE